MREEIYKNQLEEENKKLYQECVELMEKGRRKKAENLLDQFLEEKPGFVPALNKKAVIHIYKKDFNQAQSLLNRILQQDPDFAPALTNLGSIARELGNSKRAKELYQKAIKVDEDYGPAYNNLGVIYREEGNYSESIKYLKKARKRGSFSYHLNADKPFYKDPGCLFVIFLVITLITILYFLLT
ncbi:tetratricopeptide repeat protein [Halanaerobium kushneri]|uniref:Tetratricopeptide repeat-containing protein n=1 Tax=Halanaerobium kushneri TaxID=56779 RepID=A0A1N7BCQ4_9FIRM|nr:tetratricopeptide repeat protein [Halanaerobium kushneri]SIR49095.1 Tetratricopeptide repeat-containing protein [Halanaerobium kushneri]